MKEAPIEFFDFEVAKSWPEGSCVLIQHSLHRYEADNYWRPDWSHRPVESKYALIKLPHTRNRN